MIEDDERLQAELKRFGLKRTSDYDKDLLSKEDYRKVKDLMSDERIIIRKADKSNSFVVTNKESYIKKMQAIVSDQSKFERIAHNPTTKIKREINKYITSLNAVTDGVKFKKLIGHYEPAYLYGNPKIHKKLCNPPMRPIISQIGTATYEMAQQINNIIGPYMPKKYMVDSTHEFLRLVQCANVRGIMGSLDVESLFTNVPIERTIEIILQNVYHSTNLAAPSSIPEKTMKELLRLCTTGTPFRAIDGELYLQKEGVMMGSPLGPTFANYYMCHLENETAKRCPEKMPTIYARYVDDIFVVCESEDNILALKEEFERNSVLKFTHELENNNQLAFLDTLLTKHNELLATSVYKKYQQRRLHELSQYLPSTLQNRCNQNISS